MRLIDADKLETHELLEPLGIGNYEYAEVVYKDDIDDAHTIELQKWTPCSERLPEEEERSYWICLDGGGQCQCRWTNDMYGFGANEYSKWGWHIMDKPQYSKVVAWMPLPDPWKGDKE